jgi:putative molybdopterin biosynthesis protein
VASAVARGVADIGLGTEMASLSTRGVDFIPLQEERYDLVIKKEDLNSQPFRAILEIINSGEFRLDLQGMGGYDTESTGEIVAET